MNQQFINSLNEIIEKRFDGVAKRYAEAAGIKPTTLDTYLKRGSIPNGHILLGLAKAGKTTIERLLTGKEVTPEAIDTEVKEIADLVSEKGRREEWLSYGRYLATGEKQITLSPNFLMLLEKVPPNQRPEVISGWIEQAKRAEEALRLRGFGPPPPTPQKSNQPKKGNEKKGQ